VIDEQHGELVKLIAALHVFEDQKEIHDALMQLLRALREHFRDEENLMTSLEYPGYPPHRSEHLRMVSTVTSLATTPILTEDQIKENRFTAWRWFTDHLEQFDRPLVDWVRANFISLLDEDSLVEVPSSRHPSSFVDHADVPPPGRTEPTRPTGRVFGSLSP
jgi:hemerythrin